ncbi:beta-1,4-galactosyltransferase galt-1-like [Haliotis asinina]|uniref:beta-1,4-galactosyltransferase galt-1-like n=1 Tax=Haliotis asinina TaxID=109174 RepID=UPI003531C06B
MSSPLNILPVNYPGPPYNNLTRCYPAIHGNFTDVNTLVTALETGRYFGTDKFVFYNYSIPEQVNKVLLQYEREGIVEMRKWKLPFPPLEIHYWGQMASSHDCVFSQLGIAKYVLLADIDEIIVPKNNISLVALADRRLNTINPRTQNVYGALMFQNAFFALYEKETKYVFPEKEIAKKFKLRAFLHTKRSRINPPKSRSKLLVKPEAVELLHVHIIVKFRPGWETYVVNPNVALMHHYREEYDNQSLSPWRQDVTFIKYSSSLVPKLTKRLSYLQHKLGIQI